MKFSPERSVGLDLYSSPEGLTMAHDLFENNKKKIEKLIQIGAIKESDSAALRIIENNLSLLLPDGFSPSVAMKNSLIGRNLSQYNQKANAIIATKGRAINFNDLDSADSIDGNREVA